MKYKKVFFPVWGASVFKDYHLTELMTLGKKGKEKDNFSLHLLLSDFLVQYGIILSGKFYIGNFAVSGIQINKDFPKENEEIIRQLYGFKPSAIAHIQFVGDGDCAYEIEYNLDNYTCEFQRYFHMGITFKKKFKFLSDFLEKAKSVSKGKKDLYWEKLL